ncbi:MAG: MarR family transcriptional regulator [Candidatus Dojkabacteria bacterium]
MGLLSLLGLKKENDTHLEEELEKLKIAVEDQTNKEYQTLRTDIKTLFSEVQQLKIDVKAYATTAEKEDFKIDKLAEKIMEIDNDLLKVVYKDELNLVKREIGIIQDDIKNINDTQTQITDKFIDYALKNKDTSKSVELPIQTIREPLTEFEEDILTKYKKDITSEQIAFETGMSKGHISRTLKGLHKKGYLERKRKGKEFIYDKA